MIFELLRMIVDVDGRYAGRIDLRFHIGLVLILHIQWDKDDIRIQRDDLFRVKCFIIYRADKRNFFELRKIRFEMIPHISTIFAQIRINTNNEIGNIPSRQSRHRHECAARSTPLHNNALCRLFECDLLSCDIRNLNWLVVLRGILFYIAPAPASRENHADHQKKCRNNGSHTSLCLKHEYTFFLIS